MGCGWRGLLAALLLALSPAPAGSVLIASGDGSGNISAPPGDRGWSHVVRVKGLSGVYLGAGWVLTAGHVGAGEVGIGDATYAAVPDSERQLRTNGTEADLMLFRVEPAPELPPLRLRRSPTPVGTEIVMIGHGQDRGEPVTACDPPQRGWLWAERKTKRWGTNVVQEAGVLLLMRGALTRAFFSDWSESDATEHEAQVAIGDSGGGVFVRSGDAWELAGILLARSSSDCQPRHSGLFGNWSFVADLSFYVDQIEAIVSNSAFDSASQAEPAATAP